MRLLLQPSFWKFSVVIGAQEHEEVAAELMTFGHGLTSGMLGKDWNDPEM